MVITIHKCNIEEMVFKHGFYVCRVCGNSVDEYGLNKSTKKKNYSYQREDQKQRLDRNNLNLVEKSNIINSYYFDKEIDIFLDFRKIEDELALRTFKIYTDISFNYISTKIKNKPQKLFVLLIFLVYKRLWKLKGTKFYYQKDIEDEYRGYKSFKITDYKKYHKELIKILEETSITW